MSEEFDAEESAVDRLKKMEEEIRSLPIIYPSTPKLPRVSPEDLVEGEWYVFNYHQKFIPMLGKAEILQGKFRIVDSFNSSRWSWANSQIEIWGPISFELEGDA